MRILCVIDHFGSGGAQRQMVTLACGLKQRGHEVEFFTYFPQHVFFAGQVIAADIPIHEFNKGRGFSFRVVRKLSSLIRSLGCDVVLSYMASPNVYSELSCALARSTKLVISERGSHFGDSSRMGALIRRNLHRLADHIVVNSISHQSWLKRQYPWMAGRLTTIYNGYDSRPFRPRPYPPFELRNLRLIAVGRVHQGKNILTLIEALRLFHAAHGWVPSVDWVGRRDDATPSDRAYWQRIENLLSSLPAVRLRWQWLGERSDVPELLREHHALIHPTLHEGLPNAVCEALVAGRPVLASDVCDNGLLVTNGDRGFLFEPNSAESIAHSIERLAELGEEGWIRMAKACRAYAERALSLDRLVIEYEKLFMRVAASTA